MFSIQFNIHQPIHQSNSKKHSKRNTNQKPKEKKENQTSKPNVSFKPKKKPITEPAPECTATHALERNSRQKIRLPKPFFELTAKKSFTSKYQRRKQFESKEKKSLELHVQKPKALRKRFKEKNAAESVYADPETQGIKYCKNIFLFHLIIIYAF